MRPKSVGDSRRARTAVDTSVSTKRTAWAPPVRAIHPAVLRRERSDLGSSTVIRSPLALSRWRPRVPEFHASTEALDRRRGPRLPERAARPCDLHPNGPPARPCPPSIQRLTAVCYVGHPAAVPSEKCDDLGRSTAAVAFDQIVCDPDPVREIR